MERGSFVDYGKTKGKYGIRIEYDGNGKCQVMVIKDGKPWQPSVEHTKAAVLFPPIALENL